MRAGTSSENEECEESSLQEWQCANTLQSITCMGALHIPSNLCADLVRHVATLTALVTLSWHSTHHSSDAHDVRAVHPTCAAADPAGIGALASTLWELRGLRSLTVDAPEATMPAAAALAAALCCCTALTSLSVSLRSLEPFAGRSGTGARGGLMQCSLSQHSCRPLPMLTSLQRLSLRACGRSPVLPQSSAEMWQVHPRCANELVEGLLDTPALTYLCMSEVGCCRDAPAGSTRQASRQSGQRCGGQGRRGGGANGHTGPPLSPHFARLRSLQDLRLEFDFCYVGALAPQLERLMGLQRLEVRSGSSDGRRDVLKRLWRSTARLPLREGVRLRTDMPDL